MNVKLSLKPHSGSKARSQKISPHYLKARYEPPARAKEEQCKSLEWLQKQMLSINVTATSPDAAQTCSQAALISHFCYRSQTTSLLSLVRQLTLNRGEMRLLRIRVICELYTFEWNGPSWTRYILGTRHLRDKQKMINPFKYRVQCKTITLKKAVPLFLHMLVKPAKWKSRPSAKSIKA